MLQGVDWKPSDLLDGLTFIYEVGHHMKLDSIQLKTHMVNFTDKE